MVGAWEILYAHLLISFPCSLKLSITGCRFRCKLNLMDSVFKTAGVKVIQYLLFCCFSSLGSPLGFVHTELLAIADIAKNGYSTHFWYR